MTGAIIGIIVVAVVVILYLVISYFNNKSPVPEECVEAYNEAQKCTLCAKRKDCALRKTLENIKEIS
ncbi:MAG: hypothetical protein ACOX02_06385 [Acholeplasmatales bacterium]